ncbi:hypothetical protein B0H10DRAFT_2008374 [Mycena sp. CBHHK59/15]|nr:hypothetical protein B0H10DRAFT_2008374 [Mycena sp. CBHHK59/15]
MFKRVEKRRRKQEEEDELGLDDNMKEVLGMNDTDSDESDSDSDDSSEEEKVEQEQDEEEADVDEDEDEDSSDDEDEGDEPPISVEEALKDPVYIVSLQPDVKACIACPGRVLKSAEVVSVHRASKAHDRRFRQFASLAQSMKAAPDSNAWDLMKLKAQKKAEPSATPRVLSKRSQKRESVKLHAISPHPMIYS